jgi:hypothetical protein
MQKLSGALVISTMAALLALTLLTTPLSAQDTSHIEVCGGYQFAKFSNGISQKRLNANGWDVAVAFYFSRWLGIKADFSGAYGTDDTSSALPFRATNYTYALGPSFRRGFAPLGEFLLGGYKENLAGYPTAPEGLALLTRGGLDVRLHRHWSLRVAEVDWLYMSPANPAILIKRNDVRIVTGGVFRF